MSSDATATNHAGLVPVSANQKGFGSFQSPSVEMLIHQSDAEYVAPTRPDFVSAFDLTDDVIQKKKKKSEGKEEDESVSINASAFRRFFYLDPSWTFINHGAFGAAVRPLLRITNEWSVEMEKQPLRFIDRQLLPLLVDTTRKVAKFLRVPPTTITLHNNVTTALNILLNGNSIHLPAGSRVLRLNLTYGAVKKMLDALSSKGVVNVELDVPLPIASKEQILSLVSDALSQGSFALAVFDHVSSNSGLLLPIRELITMCHAKGVKVLIDGAHALGSVPDLELASSGVDFYVGNFHKWLCNPKGAAFMYVAPSLQGQIKPLIISHGTGSGYVSDFIWTGCQDYATFLTVSSTLEFWQKVGLERCIQSSHSLVLQAGRMLAKRWNTSLLVGDGNANAESELTANMLCVLLPLSTTTPPEDDEHNLIQNILHFLYQIECPIKVLGSPKRLYVRISSWVYNTLEEYERLASAIVDIINPETGHARTFSQMEGLLAERKRMKVTNGLVQNRKDTSAADNSTSSSSCSSFFPPPPTLALRPDHTQICIPPGSEVRARAFYLDLLGLVEVPKPMELETRGGFWMYCGPKLQPGEIAHANVHIGTESLPADHYAKSKAHIAYAVKNLEGFRKKLSEQGYPTIPGLPLPGMDRFDTRDPFGNRVELIEYNEKSLDPLATASRSTKLIEHEYFWRSKRAYENTPLLRVAVYQGQSVPTDIQANVTTIIKQLETAKAQKVDLVLFAELFLTGYALTREETHRLALQQSDPVIKQLQAKCKELAIALCVGYPELVINHPKESISHTQSDCSCCNPSEQRCVYNSALLISDTGEILLSYRKTHLWELVEKSFFTPGAEDALKVVTFKGVRMGINICYDIEFAENSRVLSLDGAQLLLVPTALAKGELHETVPLKVVPTRAVDNHVWIAYANLIGPSYKDKSFCGLSGIIGPDGCDLERATENQTVLLIHDLIPGDYAKRFETTPLLIDRRAELFHPLARQMEWK